MRLLLATLVLAGAISAAQAQSQADDRYPGWENRMTGRQPVKEWRWPGSVVASWYDCKKPGQCSRSKRTASGEPFNPAARTCAHRKLPFGTLLRVTYRGRSTICRVNDRGPFIKGRGLDLSAGTARAIGMSGVSVVTVERM